MKPALKIQIGRQALQAFPGKSGTDFKIIERLSFKTTFVQFLGFVEVSYPFLKAFFEGTS